jgi:tRNA A-37 threonylcarbamoyl transferase component Bud32
MPGKKGTKTVAAPAESAAQNDVTLVGVARSIGETLGTAAAKAEDAARDIETFSKAVRKSTLAKTRKLYKQAQKSLRAGATSWKSAAKKRKPVQKRSGKSTGRHK